jgi:hypothetical protein
MPGRIRSAAPRCCDSPKSSCRWTIPRATCAPPSWRGSASRTADLIEVSVYKRSYDARQKKQIQLIYTVDVPLRDDLEATVLKRQIAHVAPSPT